MNNAFTVDNLPAINKVNLNRCLNLTTLCWKTQVIRLWPLYAERSS